MTPGSNGSNSKTWCLGDACPPNYRFPEDWDVLGKDAGHDQLQSFNESTDAFYPAYPEFTSEIFGNEDNRSDQRSS